MDKYELEFHQAINNSKSLGFPIGFNQFVEKKYFNNAVFQGCHEIFSVIRWLAVEKMQQGMPSLTPIALSMIGNCGPFHYYMKPVVEKILDCKTYITIGYISLPNGSEFHKIDIKQIEQSIKSKIFPANYHVWLTMDSGEILDMTLPITLASIQYAEKFVALMSENAIEIGFINRHPTTLLHGMEYHPVAIGEELVKESGYDLDMWSKTIIADKYPDF